jgi:hypothetical protein
MTHNSQLLVFRNLFGKEWAHLTELYIFRIKQDFMPIPAHGKLTLKPGGWHIMMIQPKKVPKEGDSVNDWIFP